MALKAHWFRRVAEASGEVQLWEFPSGIGKTQRSFVLRDDTGSETESEIELEQVSHSLFIRRFLKELCSPSLYHKKPELSAQMTVRKLQVGAVARGTQRLCVRMLWMGRNTTALSQRGDYAAISYAAQTAGCLAVVIDYMGPSPEIIDAAALFGSTFVD
jgi:hypothetical protein